MNLAINTKFRPFTYDEMVKPLVQYKEVYDKMEQDYSNLASQASEFEDVANQESNPVAYNMYNTFSNKLNSTLDDFSKGLTIGNRGNYTKLRREYDKYITPIKKASEARDKANELRLKAGPDAIFQVSQYDSIDPFLGGKSANNTYQSKEALTKKTAALIGTAMAQAAKNPEFKRVMNDQFWEIIQHVGGSYEELTEALKLGAAANPIIGNLFSEVRQKVLKGIDYNKYDAAGKQQILDTVDTALFNGLDKPARSFQANADHMTPHQRMSLSSSGPAGSGSGSERFGYFGKQIHVDVSGPWKVSYTDNDNTDFGHKILANYNDIVDPNPNRAGARDYSEIDKKVHKADSRYNTLADAIREYVWAGHPYLLNTNEVDNLVRNRYIVMVDRHSGNFSLVPKTYDVVTPMDNRWIQESQSRGSQVPDQNQDNQQNQEVLSQWDSIASNPSNQ